MTPLSLRRLGLALRGTLPLLTSLALVLVSVTSLRVPDLAVITPSLAIMAVYYWSIYRPDLLPASAVFLIGLVQDVLSGGPVGVMALVLLLVRGVVVSQRRVFFGSSFLLGYCGFAIMASGAACLSWLMVSAWFGKFLLPAPLAYQTLLTIALYPCFTWLFGQVHLKALGRV